MEFDIGKISSKFRSGDYAIRPHADNAMRDDEVPVSLLVAAIGRDDPKVIEKYDYMPDFRLGHPK